MNVLLLTQVLPYPPDSGPKVKTWNVLKYVAQHHEVTLVSFVRGDQSDDVRQLEKYCRAVHTVPLQRGVWRDLGYMGLSLLKNEPFLMVRDDRAGLSAYDSEELKWIFNSFDTCVSPLLIRILIKELCGQV
jgi:hypothetical protein